VPLPRRSSKSVGGPGVPFHIFFREMVTLQFSSMPRPALARHDPPEALTGSRDRLQAIAGVVATKRARAATYNREERMLGADRPTSGPLTHAGCEGGLQFIAGEA
jgi:hypothetical protein